MTKPIFVFGSNTAGIHGAGAALHAYKACGARWGHSYGMTGDCFAIPTKGHFEKGGKQMVGHSLNIAVVSLFVHGFLAYAYTHPEQTFHVTAIGCGLAGFKHKDIAPLFEEAPDNVLFDRKWKDILHLNESHIWGEG